MEDPLKPYPRRIEGFGASVFVDDAFVDEFLGEERNYLDAALYERIARGPSPVLPPKRIAEANSGNGLNLVVLSFGLRDHDLSNPMTQRVLQMGSTAFYALHAGFRLKTVLNEVYGTQAAEYMKAGGFRLQTSAARAGSANGSVSQPHLFVLRRAWVQPGAIDTLSSLFHPPSPQIGFSPSEQRVLVHALLNQSDAEIARRLGLSLDAVKKVWRRIYDRVSRRLPYLVADERKSDRGRSSEKRRHVLEHVRAHPEEVRPTIRSGRENPR